MNLPLATRWRCHHCGLDLMTVSFSPADVVLVYDVAAPDSSVLEFPASPGVGKKPRERNWTSLNGKHRALISQLNGDTFVYCRVDGSIPHIQPNADLALLPKGTL